MPQTQIPTVSCPNCKNNLPAWVQTCQFCGSPLKGVVRPMGAPIVDTWTDAPTWHEVGYIVCSVIIILLGAVDVLIGFSVISFDGKPLADGPAAYYKIMGLISAILGLGMLFQQLWAQFLVKWSSVLKLVVALWNLLFSTMAASTAAKVLPTSTVVLIIAINAGYVAFYAFTIYIIKVVGDVDP